MPGLGPAPSEHHNNAILATERSDAVFAEELVLDLSESLFNFSSSPLESKGEEIRRVDGSWSGDTDLHGCVQLETRWILWHEFMKEHAHLDAWLRLAEQAVASPNSSYITYLAANEKLRKFEKLRCEAGLRLVQLDGLAQRNRTLTGLFQGVMQARLLLAVRKCEQRWDDVRAKLESIIERLKLFVSEWEKFEAEGEELALWLADLDIRLTEVDHLSGSTCEKLRQLQSFQERVCLNSSRVNALLQRGETLIQNSEPTDAQCIESRLLELLRRCSHIYNNIARTHTRLLSMRLVFEDDWILSQGTDSGCPSETLLEEEGVLDKSNVELPRTVKYPEDASWSGNPTQPAPLDPSFIDPPPALSFPTHEHQGLEWDPSVDIGRSVSSNDADTSYFSATTGVCHRVGLIRRSCLSSLGSQSDISNDIVNCEADLQPKGGMGHTYAQISAAAGPEKFVLAGNQWATSTPEEQDRELVAFDNGRVRVWLGAQGLTLSEGRSYCSKGVQTEGQLECYPDGSHIDKPNELHPRLSAQQHFTTPSPRASHDWYPSDPQAEEEPSFCEESERLLSESSTTYISKSSFLLSTPLPYLLLAAALALLACLIWVALEAPCHQSSSRMHRSFHLALRYINGPPPT